MVPRFHQIGFASGLQAGEFEGQKVGEKEFPALPHANDGADLSFFHEVIQTPSRNSPSSSGLLGGEEVDGGLRFGLRFHTTELYLGFK